MSHQDSFDRILESLHAAAFRDARWPAASGLIDESIGAHGNFLVIADGATQNDVLFAQLCSRGERHREWERKYYGVYYPIDERLPRIRTLPDSRLAPVPSLSTEAERKTPVVCNELLPRLRTRNGLVVLRRLHRRRQRHCKLSARRVRPVAHLHRQLVHAVPVRIPRRVQRARHRQAQRPVPAQREQLPVLASDQTPAQRVPVGVPRPQPPPAPGRTLCTIPRHGALRSRGGPARARIRGRARGPCAACRPP